MFRTLLKLLTRRLLAYLEPTISGIDHSAVLKDLSSRAELSGSYLLMIAFSCLIAWLGLITNSVAVVIGAMLISPLIGPIFTAALAFNLGDLQLAKKTMKIIAWSVLVSVSLATLFTLLSPLKVPTHEILSRTRPNIYDLLIAALAGAAGAFALCTRANYLFVTVGVAVATAVIPPLSVVGYGIGTAQTSIARGGFLLFFTNLVAIVISSTIVFHIFRFRAISMEGARYPIRIRVLILGAVLMMISAPLVYTLVVDLQKIHLTHRVEQVLKAHLDVQDFSRLTGCAFRQGRDGMIVEASVNTVRYYDDAVENRIEKALIATLKRPLRLDLEQVIVKPGHVEPMVLSLQVPSEKPPAVPRETLAVLRQHTLDRIKEACVDLQPYLRPYSIAKCDIRFSMAKVPIAVTLTIPRDYPYPEEERRWLEVTLEKRLGEGIALGVETVPLLPPLTLGTGGVLDEGSRRALAGLKACAEGDLNLRFVITGPRSLGRARDSARRGQESIKEYLIKDLGIPATAIERGPGNSPGFQVRVYQNP